MTNLINPKLDEQLFNKNQRLTYLTKLHNGLIGESYQNQKDLINTFIKESHIPEYMYQNDANEVITFLRSKKRKYFYSINIATVIFATSVVITILSEMYQWNTPLGIVSIFIASITFSSIIIINDKLFIKSKNLKNIKNLLTLIKQRQVKYNANKN